jgi:bacteriocin leader peptide (microcyclamide/patellamide family)
LLCFFFPDFVCHTPISTGQNTTGFYSIEGSDDPKPLLSTTKEKMNMNKKNITPNPKQPVDRVPAGQLPSALAELTEAALSGGTHALAWYNGGTDFIYACTCSFDGDDE